MTHSMFIRFAGWGLVAAGICLLLTFLPREQMPAGVSTLPFLLAIALTTVGLLALRVRYAAQVGAVARTGIWVGILGGAAAFVACILLAAGDVGARTAMNLAMAVMFGGLFVFGLDVLRTKPMARGNVLPALAGMWWPLIVIGATVYQQVNGFWLSVSLWPSFVLFLCMSVSLAALGYALQADASQDSMAL